MVVLLAERGFPPEQRGGGHLFLTASKGEIDRAYDDLMAWLGFACREAYHTALSTEGAAVLRRGKDVS